MRRTLFDLKMKPYGITRSQWWVLAQLSRYLSRNGEEGMLQTELAKRLDVGKVAVGGLIDRLEASGFVERRPDAKDRRAKRVVVTDKGRDVLATMAEVGHELNGMIFEGVPVERMRIAEEVLAQMKDNILRSFEVESEGGVRGGGSEPLD
ncbi:MarR family transcriptional regulator [Albimonas sp. CAU 1670]|uniref:MarR family winged helix-turn-helix transcriptional regulator n=1 Tax=Albimonas sp. CAU 1670 TaxID=3032599 RepID=UPI0023DB88AC|nr:MarR family transcriptional regulator [Albimonas sp. CAU 1670]MDF2235717.1 MarR family transcriptional regulator [Albimonas sp. CAU 1670]